MSDDVTDIYGNDNNATSLFVDYDNNDDIRTTTSYDVSVPLRHENFLEKLQHDVINHEDEFHRHSGGGGGDVDADASSRVNIVVYVIDDDDDDLDDVQRRDEDNENYEYYNDGPRRKEPLAHLTIRARHTKWHKLLLPTSPLQRVIESPDRVLRLRVVCEDCDASTEVVTLGGRRTKEAHLQGKETTGTNGVLLSTPTFNPADGGLRNPKIGEEQQEGGTSDSVVDETTGTVSTDLTPVTRAVFQGVSSIRYSNHHDLRNVVSSSELKKALTPRQQRQRQARRREERRLTRHSRRRPVLVVLTKPKTTAKSKRVLRQNAL